MPHMRNDPLPYDRRWRLLTIATVMAVAATSAGETRTRDFEHANRIIRAGVLAYGDKYYDRSARLVRRTDYITDGRLSVAQHSAEYAAALFDSGRQIERANEIVSAILDHQWNKDADRPWRKGNFIWWGDEDHVRDPNAVVFLTPWLCYISMECGRHLTEVTRRRLSEALPRCIEPIRKHPAHVWENDNHWLLRAAGLVTLARTLQRPELLAEAEARVDAWITHVATKGVSEYNSPCYAAVSIFAFEWIYSYAPASAGSLRQKTVDSLNFLYGDVFQQWHWQADIAAGTHSRAYSRDADTGDGLVAYLVFKQCGGRLQHEIRCFEYVFAVNDYPVPDAIRAFAEKKGMPPLVLRASNPVYDTQARVERSLYLLPEVSLATQTGRRPCREQDVVFKITYAGSKTDRRSSYIRAIPSHLKSYRRVPVRLAAHQVQGAAIVLYEVDLKGLTTDGIMQLKIEPAEGGMIEEFLVDSRPYEQDQLELPAGTTLGWRVAEALVMMRLLQARGMVDDGHGRVAAIPYHLGPVKGAGLCLQARLVDQPTVPVPVSDLSCGFVVRVGTVREFGSLGRMVESARGWALTEENENLTRDITWAPGTTRLRLLWDAEKNTVLARETNGAAATPHPRYDSPLVRLKPGDKPAVHLKP